MVLILDPVASHWETGVCSITKWHQNKSHLKMFLYKNLFLLIFSFLSIPIELWESTAAIFRQSAWYVYNVGSEDMNTKELLLICILFTDFKFFDIIWLSGLVLLVSITQSRFLLVGSIFVLLFCFLIRNPAIHHAEIYILNTKCFQSFWFCETIFRFFGL